MPKRTVILIAVLTVLTGVLVFLAIRNESQVDSDPDTVAGPVDEQDIQLEKTATMSFEPSTVAVEVASAGATFTHVVDMTLDTKGHSVDSVQLELQYDPSVLSNVSITASDPNFFGDPATYIEPIELIDSARGRVTYAIAISPVSDAIAGVGNVVQLSFSVNPQSTASATEIQVLDKSMANEVTTHESVLAPVDPLVITIVR